MRRWALRSRSMDEKVFFDGAEQVVVAFFGRILIGFEAA
jgi:hypothetical protein